ncbi:hypothetical protein BU16DRAFT_469749 [Lophium mytilinum]|uniref:Metallo-beta-lactamase domain-containing protein n=1 Tax=Lophium mytilinum TaxID=390894 RepID=A0A6A6QF74_9PEZI|nr:hypothetical protein BU16DRAFT_469749 [Lophium mytilinum]
MACKGTLKTSDGLLICTACGTQFEVTASSNKRECRVCDDPRQFVPPTGQTFTTLSKIREEGHQNTFVQDEVNPKLWKIFTEPQFAIGERAMLLQTSQGNVLWDLITLLNQETVDKINSLGGIAAIVISHPHYYTTYVDWALTFRCPVYTGAADFPWLERTSTLGLILRPITAHLTPILPGVTAVLCGGHFPGSLCLHWAAYSSLFIADTVVTVPSASNPEPGKRGVISYTFFWSIPNRIPLDAEAVAGIWEAVRGLEWDTTYGAFMEMDVRTGEEEVKRGTGGVKGRFEESCRIFVRAMGVEMPRSLRGKR